VHGDGKQHRQGVDQNGLDEIGDVHPVIVSDARHPSRCRGDPHGVHGMPVVG